MAQIIIDVNNTSRAIF